MVEKGRVHNIPLVRVRPEEPVRVIRPHPHPQRLSNREKRLQIQVSNLLARGDLQGWDPREDL